MKRMAITGLVLAILTSGAAAQEAQPADSTRAPGSEAAPASPPASTQPVAPAPQPAPAPAQTSSFKEKIYYGGSVTLSFGNATQIGIFPMLAYKLTPKLSIGAELGYEYVNYDDFDESSHNYGGSVFGRYRLVPQLYGHVEYQVINYEIFTGLGTSSRQTVPFLLVGGGVVKSLSPRTSVYAEVLVDVLQDDNSPYDDWEPMFTVGVGVGF